MNIEEKEPATEPALAERKQRKKGKTSSMNELVKHFSCANMCKCVCVRGKNH